MPAWLIDYLISRPDVQARLVALGWKQPGPEPKGGGPNDPKPPK